MGSSVKLSDGQFVDGNGGWGGGTDSFYEYLIKMYLYDPGRFKEYRDRWIAAADSSIKYIVSHPTTRPELTFLAMWRGKELRFVSQHRKPPSPPPPPNPLTNPPRQWPASTAATSSSAA